MVTKYFKKHTYTVNNKDISIYRGRFIRVKFINGECKICYFKVTKNADRSNLKNQVRYDFKDGFELYIPADMKRVNINYIVGHFNKWANNIIWKGIGDIFYDRLFIPKHKKQYKRWKELYIKFTNYKVQLLETYYNGVSKKMY